MHRASFTWTLALALGLSLSAFAAKPKAAPPAPTTCPEGKNPFLAEGIAQVESLNEEKALETLAKALKCRNSPETLAQVHLYLGLAHAGVANEAKAVSSFRSALTLDNTICNLPGWDKSSPRVQEWWVKAGGCRPVTPEELLAKGTNAVNTGLFDDAIKHLTGLMKKPNVKDETLTQAHLFAGVAYGELGLSMQSVAEFRLALAGGGELGLPGLQYRSKATVGWWKEAGGKVLEAPSTTTTVQYRAEKPANWKLWTGVAGTVAGAIAGGTAIAFGATARGKIADAQASTSSSAAAALEQQGKDAARNSNISAVAGGIAGALGLALLTWGLLDPPAEPEAAPE